MKKNDFALARLSFRKKPKVELGKSAFQLDIQFSFKYQGSLLRLIDIVMRVIEPITLPRGGRKE